MPEDFLTVVAIGPEGEDYRIAYTPEADGIHLHGWKEYEETEWRDIDTLDPNIARLATETAEYNYDYRTTA